MIRFKKKENGFANIVCTIFRKSVGIASSIQPLKGNKKVGLSYKGEK